VTGRLSPRATILVALLVLALFLLPWVAGKYPVYLAIQILILAVFSIGFNLLFGYTGLLSFGQAGFFAVGAYGCAKILLAVPNLFLGIAGGVAAAGVAAFILGILSVRHTRIYFSMLTLAFGMMIYSIAWKWRDYTGGDDGLVGIPRAPLEIPGLVSISMAAMEHYYYVVLVLSLAAILAMYRLVRSPLGLTLQAIRDNELRAEALGYRTFVFQLAASSFGSVVATVLGGCYTLWVRYVNPESALGIPIMLDVLLMVIIGGIGTLYGGIVGAAVLLTARTVLPGLRGLGATVFSGSEILQRLSERWLLYFGILFILVVFFFPRGVLGTLREAAARRRGAGAPEA